MAISTDTLMPIPADPLVAGLTNGTYWAFWLDRTVTWSMADFAGEGWSTAVAGPLIASAFSQYAEVADINFSYVGYSSAPWTSTADITFVRTSYAAYLEQSPNSLAWSYFPNQPLTDYLTGITGTQYANSAGDIWLNNLNPEISWSPLDPGSTIYFALLHEIGHALGLKHPHDDGATGSPTFAQLGLSMLDNQLLTIMSYDEATSIASWHEAFGLPSSVGYPSTLMPLDVIAIQSIYGANDATRPGNTLYPVYADSVIETYWDAGGTDTISAADSAFGWEINLAWAHHDSHRIALATPIDGETAETRKFFFNAEDIQGSDYDDSLTGDSADNIIDGRAGADLIDGGEGDDILDGGVGDDLLFGGGGSDILALEGNDIASGGFETDYFCFTAPGNYLITDFNPNEDWLIFDSYSTRHTDLSQLLSNLTSFSDAGGDLSFALNDGTTVQLVGCAYADISVGFYYDVVGAIQELMTA